MTLEFSGNIWYWKGPSPFYFVTVPADQCFDLKAASKFVTYGWGMIPVRVKIGETEWKTSLFPKNDAYIVPIKSDIRKVEKLTEGDHVKLRLELGL
jgi:Domain of unknown function (DUF1905)